MCTKIERIIQRVPYAEPLVFPCIDIGERDTSVTINEAILIHYY